MAKGINYLRDKLAKKRGRVLLRYDYYNMKQMVPDFGISTPPKMRNYQAVLGWCGKSVDAVADRLVFREFRNDRMNMNEIFGMNNPDVLFDSAFLSALISSCCFIYISKDENGFPRLQVIDGGNATGVIDPITGLLSEGYAVLERDERGNPTIEAYFLPRRTEILRVGEPVEVFTHVVDYPLLVPIINRPDATRPFGHSLISRACMDIVKSASRTIKRSEISAEFYSFPQKYIVGLSEDVEISDKWSMAMSSLITLTKDEDGDKPTFGQFSQQSMSPHSEQLKMFASLFAGETGLTTDDLGFVTDNPSSAEAIKSSHENLRLKARKCQRTFGSGFLNVGYLSACLRDDKNYNRGEFYLTTPIWEPIFEPDSSMMSSIGDGVIKLNQAIPDFITSENLSEMTGIKTAE